MKFAKTIAALAILWCPGGAVYAQQQENPLEPPPATPAAGESAASASDTPPAPVESSAGVPSVLLGLGAGAYIPTSDLSLNFLVGIDAAYQLPWLAGRFGIGAGLAYSQPTTSGELSDDRVPGGKFGYQSTMRELMLDLLLTFRIFGWDRCWSPSLGLGPVIYFLSHEVQALDHTQTETSSQGGFLATAGVDYRLWRGALVGEIRFPFATVGQRTTGGSNVGALSVVLAYRFRL